MGFQQPKSIAEAVQLLLTELSEKDRLVIKIMAEEQLSSLHFSLGNCIRNHFGLWGKMRNFLPLAAPMASDEAQTTLLRWS